MTALLLFTFSADNELYRWVKASGGSLILEVEEEDRAGEVRWKVLETVREGQEDVSLGAPLVFAMLSRLDSFPQRATGDGLTLRISRAISDQELVYYIERQGTDSLGESQWSDYGSPIKNQAGGKIAIPRIVLEALTSPAA